METLSNRLKTYCSEMIKPEFKVNPKVCVLSSTSRYLHLKIKVGLRKREFA